MAPRRERRQIGGARRVHGSEVPVGWTAGHLRDLFVSVEAGTWGEDPRGDATDVRCVRAADFDRELLRTRLDKMPLRHVAKRDLGASRLMTGDIVLEKAGGGELQPVGAAVLFDLPDTAVCSNFAARARPMPGIDPRYALYSLNLAYRLGLNAGAIKQTTGIQNLDDSIYLAALWPIPPRSEQERIAGVIDSVTHQLRNVRLEIQKMEMLLAGARNGVFSPDQPTQRLVDLAVRPGEYGVGASARKYDPALPRYVRITDIGEDGRLLDATRASLTVEEAIGYRVLPNDLLFARSGSVGKAHLYDPTDGDCAYAGYLIRFAMDPSKCHPQYVAQFLRSETYWRWIGRTARQSAQPNINAEEYATLPVPSPDLELQRSAAAALNGFDDSLRIAHAHRAKLLMLRDGLSLDLLTGRRRVPDVSATTMAPIQ